MTQTWADKHAPEKLSDVVGHTTTVKKVREWAENWKKGKAKKPLLLHGPPGSGKTAIVEAVSNEYNWELLELNASDKRNKESIEDIAGSASTSNTLSGKKRLILFDEVDGLFRQDYGAAGAINQVIKDSSFPIILTANDAYDKKLKTIRRKCQKVEVKKVHPSTIAKLLGKIAKEKEIDIEKDTLKKIAKSSDGDVRGAINDLQALAEGKKELNKDETEIMGKRRKKESIFKALKQILKKRDFQGSMDALKDLDEDPDFILKWIDENLPKEYEEPQELHQGFEKVSKADRYLGRVYNRQNFGLWRYANALMGPGVSLAKEQEKSGYTKYQFPSLIRKLGSTKSERNTRESIASKIGERCHVSMKTAINDYIPMIEEMMNEKDKRIRLTAQFDFTEKELKLLGVSQRKRTLKKAKKLKEDYISGKITQGEEKSEKKKETEDNGETDCPQRSLNQF